MHPAFFIEEHHPKSSYPYSCFSSVVQITFFFFHPTTFSLPSFSYPFLTNPHNLTPKTIDTGTIHPTPHPFNSPYPCHRTKPINRHPCVAIHGSVKLTPRLRASHTPPTCTHSTTASKPLSLPRFPHCSHHHINLNLRSTQFLRTY